jgi:hypothetical protein
LKSREVSTFLGAGYGSAMVASLIANARSQFDMDRVEPDYVFGPASSTSRMKILDQNAFTKYPVMAPDGTMYYEEGPRVAGLLDNNLFFIESRETRDSDARMYCDLTRHSRVGELYQMIPDHVLFSQHEKYKTSSLDVEIYSSDVDAFKTVSFREAVLNADIFNADGEIDDHYDKDSSTPSTEDKEGNYDLLDASGDSRGAKPSHNPFASYANGQWNIAQQIQDMSPQVLPMSYIEFAARVIASHASKEKTLPKIFTKTKSGFNPRDESAADFEDVSLTHNFLTGNDVFFPQTPVALANTGLPLTTRNTIALNATIDERAGKLGDVEVGTAYDKWVADIKKRANEQKGIETPQFKSIASEFSAINSLVHTAFCASLPTTILQTRANVLAAFGENLTKNGSYRSNKNQDTLSASLHEVAAKAPLEHVDPSKEAASEILHASVMGIKNPYVGENFDVVNLSPSDAQARKRAEAEYKRAFEALESRALLHGNAHLLNSDDTSAWEQTINTADEQSAKLTKNALRDFSAAHAALAAISPLQQKQKFALTGARVTSADAPTTFKKLRDWRKGKASTKEKEILDYMTQYMGATLNKETIQLFLDHDIPLPFTIDLIRPWITFRTGSLWMGVAGADTAISVSQKCNLMLVPDGMIKKTYLNSTAYMMAMVINRRNLVHMLDVFPIALLGGFTTRFLKDGENDVLNRERKSIIAVANAVTCANRAWPIDIAATQKEFKQPNSRLPSNMVMSVSDIYEPYPCASVVKSKWSVQSSAEEASEMQTFTQEMRAFNTIVYSGPTRRRNAEGVFGEATKGNGHLAGGKTAAGNLAIYNGGAQTFMQRASHN